MPGELEVTKTIDGPAAGSQGQVVIQTVCNGTALTPDFVIHPGTPAGAQSHLYTGISTPADCVVAETTDGGTSTVTVDVAGSPARPATIPGGGAEPRRSATPPASPPVRCSCARRSWVRSGPARADHDPDAVQRHGLDPRFCDRPEGARGGPVEADPIVSPLGPTARSRRPLTGAPVPSRSLSRGAGRRCPFRPVAS